MMNEIMIRHLGMVDYLSTWQAMRELSNTREVNTPDEIWLLEHPRVFTLGQAGKEEHILRRSDIPVVKSDRGGQVTYHGPGQLIAYLMIDLKRRQMGIRSLVSAIENAVIDLLAQLTISANSRKTAPGVYVKDEKICAIGLRVRKGCTYHGLALNIDMDLEPYNDINPCGYPNLKVTQIKDHTPAYKSMDIPELLIQHLKTHLTPPSSSPSLASSSSAKAGDPGKSNDLIVNLQSVSPRPLRGQGPQKK